MVVLASLVIAWGLSSGKFDDGNSVLQTAAYTTGFGLGISVFLDLRHGWRNLVRADILMLMAVYALTLAEFLTPQPGLATVMSVEQSAAVANLVFLSFGGIAIGRHLAGTGPPFAHSVCTLPTPPSFLIALFWFCFCLGFAHQWIAVDFNPARWVTEWGRMRWAQSWGRGMLGDWKALFYELGLLLHILPPLGAIIIARPKLYSQATRILVILGVSLVFLWSFSSGTRHIFFAHVIMFTTALCYFRTLTPWGVFMRFGIAMCILYPASMIMVTFRQKGLWWYLETLWSGTKIQGQYTFDVLYVDWNLLSMSRLMQRVPLDYDFQGLSVFYYSLIRPIPRALWPEKPIGVVGVLTEALQEEGSSLTYSVTYIGEAWLAGGYWAVIATSLFFGWLGGYWNRFGNPRHSDLGILIFASGFLSLAIAMRSMITFTTFLLPTLFLIIVGLWYVSRRLEEFRMKGLAAPSTM